MMQIEKIMGDSVRASIRLKPETSQNIPSIHLHHGIKWTEWQLIPRKENLYYESFNSAKDVSILTEQIRSDTQYWPMN